MAPIVTLTEVTLWLYSMYSIDAICEFLLNLPIFNLSGQERDRGNDYNNNNRNRTEQPSKLGCFAEYIPVVVARMDCIQVTPSAVVRATVCHVF